LFIPHGGRIEIANVVAQEKEHEVGAAVGETEKGGIERGA
jgi:hypothetical protein